MCGANLLTSPGSAETRSSERASPPVGLPSPVVPAPFGVNIHFTEPLPGEAELLRAAGFAWVRMDLLWHLTERTRNTYDFSAYDRLFAALDRQGIRPLFILDYHNKLYDRGLSPYTDAGRAAFTRWAVAAVRHFRGRGALWEIYNEPNAGFWHPKANVGDYVQLALTVSRALRQAAPKEPLIGPATAGVDLPFLEACFRAGLLKYWSAVSVHPYRVADPETVGETYQDIRRLIARYSPGKDLPIIASEWGYSAAEKEFDTSRQGKYLARQWLTNLLHGIPLSIWYDWRDDGADPNALEHNFGAVYWEHVPARDPVLLPKPVYQAARTLTSELAGFRLERRLPGTAAEDYVLRFVRADQPEQVRLAAWTTAAPHSLKLPALGNKVQRTDHLGNRLPPLAVESGFVTVRVTDNVEYLAMSESRPAVSVARPVANQPEAAP